jgi:hypothetical protein
MKRIGNSERKAPGCSAGICGRDLAGQVNPSGQCNGCFTGADLAARRRIGQGLEITIDDGDGWQDHE